ncbi:DDE-type integrase/transposase/recombinase [Shimia thalassica]|nr:DDE-type integrase/transposase/recombinase [Shimia thalassica]MDO6482018.1 DDE-type integrase/transposase/recombinase [Shimia thalassica]
MSERIAGRKYWFWRAVDQHGVVLDEVLQPKRGKRAAKRLLRRLMKRLGFITKRIIIDKHRLYGAVKRKVAPGLDHWSHKGLNSRAENSHLSFLKRERTMPGHRSPGGLRRFVATHSTVRKCFYVPARRRSAITIRYHRLEAFDAWNAVIQAA